MSELSSAVSYTANVSNFQDLVLTPFDNGMNAIGWIRLLQGDFSEIVNKFEINDNITQIDEHDLLKLELNEDGHLARQVLLSDLSLLKAYGAAPCLNLISHYERDNSFFPTDVYSYHVDRAPVSTDTILCTYYGATSEILPNAQAEQKILIPEIRDQLKKLYSGPDDGFASFLSDHFFDLHYSAKDGATPVSLGMGHMWRIAVDHPDSKVLPCIHRAPDEKPGHKRLLLIC